jgi:hypothetical protein
MLDAAHQHRLPARVIVLQADNEGARVLEKG